MKTQTFNISMPVKLVKEADEIAKSEYRNRSELIREALTRYITSKRNWDMIFAYGEKQAKKLGITSEEQINDIVSEYRHGK